MKTDDCFAPLRKEHVEEQINMILEGKGAELRLEITVLDNVIANLETLSNDSSEAVLGDDEADRLLDWILDVNVSAKHLRGSKPIVTKPSEGWTVDNIRGAVGELAEALSKSTEAIIAATIQRVSEERDEKRQKLQTAWHYIEHDGLPKPETAALLSLYDRRLLTNLTRYYNLLERLQSSRLGKPSIPTAPVDVTITHDVNGEG